MKKMCKRLIKHGVLLSISLAIVGMLYTTTGLAQTQEAQRWFLQRVTEKPLTAVYFYKQNQEGPRKIFEQAQRMLVNEYPGILSDSGIKFVRVNIDKPGFNYVVQKYNLKNFPVIVLFKGGQPDIVDNEPATMTGFTTAAQIVSFLEDNYAQDLHHLSSSSSEYDESENNNEYVPYRVVRRTARPAVNFNVGVGYPYGGYWNGSPYDYYGYYRPYWYPDAWTGWGWNRGYGYYGRPSASFGLGFSTGF